MPQASAAQDRRGPWIWPLVAAALSGALLGALFPSLGWDWMAWFALVPLWIVVARADGGWRAFWPGYLAGAVFFAVSCPWIATTIHNYGNLAPAMAGLVFVLFLGLMGSYLGLFAVLGYWLGRRSGHRLLPLPFLWVAIELLRTYTPMGGFPWNLLGYSQFAHAGFMLIVPLAGVYGASLVIAVANTLLAALALRFFDRGSASWPRRGDALAALGLALILAYASWPYHAPVPAEHPLHAILVQPNTPLDAAWGPGSLADFLRQQSKLSRPAPGMARPDLILWPEQPAPLDFATQPEFQASTAELISRSGAAFLFGEVTGPPNAPRNSSLFIHRDGTTGARYDKLHLVPFGEYVPLPGWVQRIGGISKLLTGVSDFVPGDRRVLFDLDGHPFATLICYESIFPELARRDVADGAQFLVNQSDDSWYGQSSAAAQGLMMARVRAMENRRWLLRDTDDGLTAVIDPYGRVTAELPRFRAASLDVGFAPDSELTFYTRHGDWLAYLCCLVGCLFAVVALARSGRREAARW